MLCGVNENVPKVKVFGAFKLGITSFFVKASISALKAFPRLNAEIQGDEIVIKRYFWFTSKS